MALKLITPPASLALTLSEMRADLRDPPSTLDATITRLIRGATEQAEHEIGRTIMAQQWELVLDAFPGAEIELPKNPVTSITSVMYQDTAGAWQTLADTEYTLDPDVMPAWLFPAEGAAWPSTKDAANAVRVRFWCGLASTAAQLDMAHANLRNWISLQVSTMFENTDGVSLSKADPNAGRHLLDKYRSYL